MLSTLKAWYLAWSVRRWRPPAGVAAASVGWVAARPRGKEFRGPAWEPRPTLVLLIGETTYCQHARFGRPWHMRWILDGMAYAAIQAEWSKAMAAPIPDECRPHAGYAAIRHPERPLGTDE